MARVSGACCTSGRATAPSSYQSTCRNSGCKIRAKSDSGWSQRTAATQLLIQRSCTGQHAATAAMTNVHRGDLASHPLLLEVFASQQTARQTQQLPCWPHIASYASRRSLSPRSGLSKQEMVCYPASAPCITQLPLIDSVTLKILAICTGVLQSNSLAADCDCKYLAQIPETRVDLSSAAQRNWTAFTQVLASEVQAADQGQVFMPFLRPT